MEKNEPTAYRVFWDSSFSHVCIDGNDTAVTVSVPLFGRCIINSYRSEDKKNTHREKKVSKLVISYLEWPASIVIVAAVHFSTLLLCSLRPPLSFKCSFSLIYPLHIFSWSIVFPIVQWIRCDVPSFLFAAACAAKGFHGKNVTFNLFNYVELCRRIIGHPRHKWILMIACCCCCCCRFRCHRRCCSSCILLGNFSNRLYMYTECPSNSNDLNFISLDKLDVDEFLVSCRRPLASWYT